MVGEQGVSDWPISDLADRADVALGSFYNHFADRDEFLQELVQYYVLDRQEQLLDRNIPDGGYAVRVAHRFAYLVDLAIDDTEHRRFFVSVGLGGFLYRDDVNAGFEQRLTAALAAGHIVSRDVAFTLSCLRGLGLSLFRHIDFIAATAPETINRATLRAESIRMALAISNVSDVDVEELMALADSLEPLNSAELMSD